MSMWQVERRRKPPYTRSNPWRWQSSSSSLERAIEIATALERAPARAYREDGPAITYIARVVWRSHPADVSDRWALERYRTGQPLNKFAQRGIMPV